MLAGAIGGNRRAPIRFLARDIALMELSRDRSLADGACARAWLPKRRRRSRYQNENGAQLARITPLRSSPSTSPVTGYSFFSGGSPTAPSKKPGATPPAAAASVHDRDHRRPRLDHTAIWPTSSPRSSPARARGGPAGRPRRPDRARDRPAPPSATESGDRLSPGRGRGSRASRARPSRGRTACRRMQPPGLSSRSSTRPRDGSRSLDSASDPVVLFTTSGA